MVGLATKGFYITVVIKTPLKKKMKYITNVIYHIKNESQNQKNKLFQNSNAFVIYQSLNIYLNSVWEKKVCGNRYRFKINILKFIYIKLFLMLKIIRPRLRSIFTRLINKVDIQTRLFLSIRKRMVSTYIF